MVKFYNIFKPHVIYDKGAYYVRRFQFFGWQYRSWDDPESWNYSRQYYNRLSTKQNAFMLKSIPKNKVKVFHDYDD